MWWAQFIIDKQNKYFVPESSKWFQVSASKMETVQQQPWGIYQFEDGCYLIIMIYILYVGD